MDQFKTNIHLFDLIKKWAPAIILGLCLLIIYLGSMAPGLSWANNGVDGGDLITASATGGIPHPPGYPTYLLLAGLAQKIPFGTLAYRTNLMSAIFAVMTVILVYTTLVHLPDSRVRGNRTAGVIAGFMVGLAPLIWSQAVITEVYTLHAFFITLSILLALWKPKRIKPGWMDCLRGLVMGISTGNHITFFIMIPGLLINGMWKSRKDISWSALFRSAAGFIGGLAVYLTLPIRAISNPPVSWGNPASLSNFVWLVTGELYQRRLLNLPTDGLFQRLHDLVDILLRQFEPPGLLLGLVGLILFFKPNRIYLITLWNAILFTLFAVVYTSFDSYFYLIPVLISVSIWIGLGFGELINEKMSYFPGLKLSATIAIFVLLGSLVIQRWSWVNASTDMRAQEYGTRAMDTLPQNAIVFARDDPAVFTLWYFHFALHNRPDLSIVATDLLHFEWYSRTLRSTYPTLSLPEDLPWQETITAANRTRPFCEVNFAQGEDITCSSR